MILNRARAPSLVLALASRPSTRRSQDPRMPLPLLDLVTIPFLAAKYMNSQPLHSPLVANLSPCLPPALTSAQWLIGRKTASEALSLMTISEVGSGSWGMLSCATIIPFLTTETPGLASLTLSGTRRGKH
jgi:hypothetical protein